MPYFSATVGAGGGGSFNKRVLAAFAVSILLCSLLIFAAIKHMVSNERKTMELLITEKSIKITDVVSRLLYKTQALSALVIQNDGEIREFDRIAAAIVDDPAILNILLAPGGTVSEVYPLAGNEKLIGYSLFGDGAGNKEAVMARDTGRMVFGGPFKLMQGGGQALVGRLPVWLHGENGDSRFWGLVSVTLKYPEVLYGAGLDTLAQQGFAYEIWRINPDDSRRQVIASDGREYSANTRYVDKHIRILNTDWYFRILPVRDWYEYSRNWAFVLIGLLISLLVAWVTRSNCDLEMVKQELESMVRTDALTGLLNRQGLLKELEKLILRRIDFKLCFMDLNYFKQINDTYGHGTGDYVLIEFSRKIAEILDDKYIFARFSGDEFILVRHGRNFSEVDAAGFWERIERQFAEPIVGWNGDGIVLSFSKGIASYPADGKTIDDLITCADQRMYQSKNARYVIEKRRRSDDMGRLRAGRLEHEPLRGYVEARRVP